MVVQLFQHYNRILGFRNYHMALQELLHTCISVSDGMSTLSST